MLTRFHRDRRGNVLPIFALAAIPLFVAAGGVVDYTNAFDQRTVVQDAMDAAALAAGKQVALMTTQQIQALADQFFLANISPDKVDNVPDLQTTVANSTVDINTTLRVPTYFLGLIGLNEFAFPLHSQVTVGMGTLEVALVLDNSTSMTMPNSKIETLRTAANNLVNTLYALGSTSNKPDPVKVALAPFAASVNVGSNQTSWVDTAGKGTYVGDAAKGEGAASTLNPYAYYSTLQNSSGTAITWGGCLEERPMPYDVQDDAPSTANNPNTEEKKTLFVPMFAPDEPDNWSCTTSSSACSFAGTSNSTRRYIGAPTGNQTYNNYLPDASGGSCSNPLTTFTATSANPTVLTKSSHGLSAGAELVLNTTGSLLTGLTAGASYYVAPGTAANNFKITTQSSGSTFTIAFNSSNTFTVTKANPAVFSKSSHGLTAGSAIKLTTTGTMYSPLTNNGVYYVLSASLATGSFRVSTSSGGSAVNTSNAGNQSGTHSYVREAVFTRTNHGLAVGDSVVFTTTGTLPTGLSANTVYYVRSVPSTSTFTVSATDGGAPIFPTGSQSGTHSFYKLVETSGNQSGTHSYTPIARTAEWTCQSGDAGCGGTNVGRSEETGLAGVNISSAQQCKYGTAANKGTVASISLSSMPGGPNFMCTTSAVTPLTTVKATVTSRITNLQAVGYTNITAGVMWGWRLLSPGIPFTEGRAYDDNENQKILIVMTDGENTYSPYMDKDTNPSTSSTAAGKFTKSLYGAWGYLYKNHFGTTSTSSATVFEKLNARTALACANAKAAGIKVYTVAFQVTDADTLAMLTACATEPDMAYQSNNNAALLAAFQAIGDDISLLRIAQ